MIGEDRVIMSGKELRRIHVLRQVMAQKLTQVKAGALMGLTARHVRRLLQQVRMEGDAGLVHCERGKSLNRRMSESIKAKLLMLYAQRCGDFGPPLAVEQLAARQGIMLSEESMRR